MAVQNDGVKGHIEDNYMDLFFELVQVSLENRVMLSRVPTVNEWEHIYLEAQRQAVLGLIVEGINILPKT